MEPIGTDQEKFVLMLHDRLVELESEVKDLRPRALDPRVTLLGTHERSQSGSVFVRLYTSWNVDLGQLCAATLGILGPLDNTRYDMWACQHWTFADTPTPFIIEMVVERSGGGGPGGGLEVAKVAHAALDSLMSLTAKLLRVTASADACALHSPTWFAESVRVAAATGQRQATLHSWDPSCQKVVTQDINDIDETGTRTPSQYLAWTMLHGWMAHQMAPTDVWHPRGLSNSKCAIDIVSAIGGILDNQQ